MDIGHLEEWIGREETASETLTPEHARRFEATFGREATPAPGDIASPLIHLALAQPALPMSALGRDGHPALGGFLPPVPLPRRMWAGGEMTFHGDIRVGESVTRRSAIAGVTLKEGRTGPLCFVTVEHDIDSDGRAVLAERQDIVYRDIPATAQAKASSDPAPVGSHSRTIAPTPTLLFRYSALTFNGHRIHYDRTFCTGTEGYPGLVVHGPMQATLLCRYAAELKGARPVRFAFRSLSPLFDDADMTLNAVEDGEVLRLWTARPGGPVAMEATAAW